MISLDVRVRKLLLKHLPSFYVDSVRKYDGYHTYVMKPIHGGIERYLAVHSDDTNSILAEWFDEVEYTHKLMGK
ncbi:hypothetical protein NVP1262O_72 [Vibrio phage 1.262.O._10N.286.51.A9]|nr:hypothetical protein NVP1262O_72 [Vibrio phage 1.262.O._10N.286.51.A9]